MKFRYVSVKVREIGGLATDHNVYDVGIGADSINNLIDQLEGYGFEIINIIPLYNFTEESYLNYRSGRK